MADKMEHTAACKRNIHAIHDTMDILGGKWKITIMAVLCYHGDRRFSEILSGIGGISNRMLSKELKELEASKLVERTVHQTQPITVSYRLTPCGEKLRQAVQSLADWAMEYRKDHP